MSKSKQDIEKKEIAMEEAPELPQVDMSEIPSFDSPDTEQIMLDFIPQIDCSNLAKCEIDKTLFLKGMTSVSELCGQITALANVGIPPLAALSILTETQSTDKMLQNQIDVTTLNANASVESSKYGMAQMSKMAL